MARTADNILADAADEGVLRSFNRRYATVTIPSHLDSGKLADSLKFLQGLERENSRIELFSAASQTYSEIASAVGNLGRRCLAAIDELDELNQPTLQLAISTTRQTEI